MIARLQYQNDTAGETAMLYLSGTWSDGDGLVLQRILSAIAADVRTLRLTTHGEPDTAQRALTLQSVVSGA